MRSSHGPPGSKSSPPPSGCGCSTRAERSATTARSTSFRGGRLELVLGDGPGRGVHNRATPNHQAAHEMFRRHWEQARASTTAAPPRVWQRCTLSRAAVDRAARYAGPIFLTGSTALYAALREWYRSRRAHHGHDPDGGLVGVGGVPYYGARRSQDAVAAYRPIFEARLARARSLGRPVPYASLADAVRNGAVLVGSPQQIVDTLLGQYARLGPDVLHLHAGADGLTAGRHRATLELFRSEIAPVLVHPLEQAA